jgi:hypothetical protein
MDKITLVAAIIFAITGCQPSNPCYKSTAEIYTEPDSTPSVIPTTITPTVKSSEMKERSTNKSAPKVSTNTPTKFRYIIKSGTCK